MGARRLLGVLDAHRFELLIRDQLISTDTGIAVALVSLYRALREGWWDDPKPGELAVSD